ncbi:MAG: PilC/PilY family type IV pilus protein [Lysobacteraceae bacterium]
MSTIDNQSVIGRLTLAVAVSALCFVSNVHAGLASVPLSVANSVEPNLLLVLDDSGSMDWEMLFPTDSGQLEFQVSSDSNGTFLNSTGGLRASGNVSYSYLFPNGTGTGNKVYGYSNGNGRALPPRPELAFARSSDYNGQYYDPMVNYRPWIKADGSFYPNATPSNAISDPAVSGSNRMDLTADLYPNDNEWRFYTARSMREENGSGYPGNNRETNNSGSTQRYHYRPATYYVRITSNIALPSWLGGNCSTQPYSRYNTFYNDWSATRQTALEGVGVDAIAYDGACLKKYDIMTATSFPSGRTRAAELQNFANWFSYYRKRHMALRSALGIAFADKSSMSVGAYEINDARSNSSLNVSMWNLDTNKSNLFDYFYDQYGESNSTPNRDGLSHAGRLFNDNVSGQRDIIKYACQQNFALHFTDGFNNLYPNTVGNADGNDGAPYSDNQSNTLGDIAMYYYETRLRSGDFAAGKVPVRAECSTANPPAWMDCNQNLHMNTYGIMLGSTGDIFGRTHNTVLDAYDSTPSWPTNSTASGREQVDDLYHAAVNGRGQMFNAQNSTELSQKLSEALKAILGSVISSASVVSSNSTRLDTSTVLYQAQFDSKDWSGRLLKIGIGVDGTIGAVEADAANEMPGHSARDIYTRTGEFKWASLSPAVQALFNVGPDAVVDGLGEQRVNWIRGDHSNEQQNGGALRDREFVLGDIVDSSPTFVGGQNFGYDILPPSAGGNTYRAYVNNNSRSRSKLVYVGANDGMVHAFDAETLREKFAYVPTEHLIGGQLPRLTDPSYRHRYFVDGTPVSSDVYIGGSWKTYLVGSLGAGGRTVYALDITSPDSFNSSDIKWEFQAPGYVLGRPSVARMQNGSWAVIVGGGYESGQTSKLFVLNIANGSVIKSFDLGGGIVGNGLSSPIPVDIDSDRVADYIYAGDLDGNLWKFDVTGTSTGSWDVAFGGKPLFTACDGSNAGPYGCPASGRQPITMRPQVGRGPYNEGMMVYFGTGSYVFSGDSVVANGDPTQAFYAIHDENETSTQPVKRSELTQQSIASESAAFRTVSSTEGGANDKGWYMNLVSPSSGFEGERAVSDPLLRSGRIIFPTLIPNTDPCEGGGSSWLMEMDALSGHAIDPPVFDVNGDGVIDENDLVNGVPPAGINPDIGIIDTPNVLDGENTGDNDVKCVAGSTGRIECIGERAGDDVGRNSWQQVWPAN